MIIAYEIESDKEKQKANEKDEVRDSKEKKKTNKLKLLKAIPSSLRYQNADQFLPEQLVITSSFLYSSTTEIDLAYMI